MKRTKFQPTRTQVDDTGRVCVKCYQWKPWTEYNKQSRHFTGYNPRCKRCKLDEQLLYRGTGWTVEMRESAFLEQNGKCANPACSNIAAYGDHNHETGEPRAMLCLGCNTSLGHLKDDPELIRGLAEYVERHNRV